jgi:acetoacetyl-CoA reductase
MTKALLKEPRLEVHTNPAKGISLVTGGTGGIGSAICKQISNLGYHVITTYRDEDKAKRWQQEMYEQGYGITIMKCDVANFEDCESLVEQITSKWGPVNILVNNAGITRDSTFRKMTKDQWRDVISCDLDSVFNVT